MSKQIMFHGGCRGCTQQELHGVDFCFDCCHFDAEWDKPNMNNAPPSEADIIRAQVKKRRASPLEKILHNPGINHV